MFSFFPLNVLKNLLDDGFDVLQISDGFYMDKECKDIEGRIKKVTEYYYKRYKDNNNNNTIVKKFTNAINTLVSLALEDDSEQVVLNSKKETKIKGSNRTSPVLGASLT